MCEVMNTNEEFVGLMEGFEGPEKRLEVLFKYNAHDLQGMRAIDKDQWQDMLDLVRCLIVSQTSTEILDSFVLSESSLFVYPYKIVIKTCGTTRLLKCLDKLNEYAHERGTEIEYAMFSRKNYNFPHRQKTPHCSFEMELETLNAFFNHQGESYVLGPRISGFDEEYVYVFGNPKIIDSDCNYNAPSFEMMMSQLDANAMNNFFRNENYIDAATTTKQVGLSTIIPDLVTDQIMFDPCGYSINGISKSEGSYFTVHVTPESHCSFVSFETNSRTSLDGNELVNRVVDIFKPGKFTLVYSFTNPKLFMNKIPQLEGFKTLYEFTGPVESNVNMIVCHYTKA